MARTYWDKKKDGSFEFLGAFKDDHQVKDKKQPQARGVIIDIPDLDIQGVLDHLADRVLLVGLPTSIKNRMTGLRIAQVPWNQLEGFVK